MNTALDIAKQALNDILDPIGRMERELPEGYRLNGHAALQQMNSREFYIRIAREALAAIEASSPAPAALDYTEGHCAEKRKPGGCQLHNLHCGYPKCDRRPA